MNEKPRLLIDKERLDLIINRLCCQLIECHSDLKNTAIFGIQPRGSYFSDRIVKRLKEMDPNLDLNYGKIDPTFYRDDFRTKNEPIIPSSTEFDFEIDNKHLILIDDVFYTGRTVRSALDAIHDFGRPSKVNLLVLINRRFSKELPIQPDYVGERVDSIASEKVIVEWTETHGEDKVLLYRENI
jgi:pyrimidine operon attenuation protein/uracil phosphoribosyltransferase